MMPATARVASPTGKRLWPIFAAIALAWTILVAVSLATSLLWLRRDIIDAARFVARASLDKERQYRRWAAAQGGVDVPVTSTLPDANLSHLPERDITTSAGQLLTLVNPAYLTRQVHDQGASEYGVRGHLTSLKPLRAENAPDDWERQALVALDGGLPEVSAVVESRDGPTLRLMRPLATEERCLDCHAQQGYAVGVVRGGLGASVPMAMFDEMRTKGRRRFFIKHGLAWMLGLGLLVSSGRAADRRLEQRVADQARLRAMDERLDIALRGGRLVLWEWDLRDGRFRFDERAGDVLGLAPETVHTAAEMTALLHPEDRMRLDAIVRHGLAAGGDDHHLELRIRGRDGGWHWIEARGRVVKRDARGRALEAAGAVIDAEERVRSREERDQLASRLAHSQKLEALGQLTGGIAHDFNNLLMPILGYLELILRTLPADAPMRADLLEMKAAAQRGRDLTRRLLAFGRRQVLTMAVVDLNQLVSGMESMLQRLIGPGIGVRLELTATPLPITADRSQLEVVLLNLALNARDAMPKGGTLTVGTELRRLDAAAAAHLSLMPGEYACLWVSDTGTGMSPEALEHLFEPFFTTKPVGSGTGLGLASVHGVVRQHGGGVDVTTELGRGTRFNVYLVPTDSAELASNAAEEVPAADGECVMVVEDNSQVRGLVHRMLGSLGYRVHAVADAETALALAAQPERIDLLISDVMMPKMTGLELARRLGALRPEVPVLFVSGYAREVLAKQGALDAGVRLLTKPFTLARLGREVREALDSRRA